MTLRPNRPACRAAFTLIELAMTALLLSMGLLSVFALLRRGLASRAEMEGELRGTAFADAAFNTLRAVSEHTMRQSDTNDLWTAFWTDFQYGATNIALTAQTQGQDSDPATDPAQDPAQDPATDPAQDLSHFYGDGELRAYRWIPDDTVSNAAPILRYRCSVDILNSFESSSSEIFLNHPTNRVHVTLHVWPSGLTSSSPQTFFTLFSNRGRLP